MANTVVVYRYSDANTYTDYDTKEEAFEAKRKQGGGSVVRLTTPASAHSDLRKGI